MPNWCHNRLTVKSENPELILKFRNDFDQGEGAKLANLVPFPLDLDLAERREWCARNWGPKYEIIDPQTWDGEKDGTVLSLEFDTSWDAPSVWVKTVAEKYLGISFRLEFVEPSMNFSGVIEYSQDGQLISDEKYGTADSPAGRSILGDDSFEEEVDDEDPADGPSTFSAPKG